MFVDSPATFIDAMIHRIPLPLLAFSLLLSAQALAQPGSDRSIVGRPDRWALDSTVDITLLNLGAPVNSASLEYAPAVGPDGLRLYFVSDRAARKDGHNVWTTTHTSAHSLDFTRPELVQGEINSDENDGALVISADGKRVYFSSCYQPKGYGDCDLYTGELKGTTVRKVKNLGKINTPDWESQPGLSSSGDTLYFSTTATMEPEDMGSTDLKFIVRDRKGNWSKPRSVGREVNTYVEDQSPCVVSGGSVLLFTSNRQGGYGGFDIYFSVKEADGTWGPATNLGPRINSIADERSVSASPDGMTLYICSGRDATGGKNDLDLYIVYPLLRPLPREVGE